jgi:hypothetical protein
VKPTRALNPHGTYFVTFSSWAPQVPSRRIVCPTFPEDALRLSKAGKIRITRFRRNARTRSPVADPSIQRHIGAVNPIHQRRLLPRVRRGVEPKRGSMATRIHGTSHPGRSRLRRASQLHPRESSEARASGVAPGLPLLLSLPRIQTRQLALSG